MNIKFRPAISLLALLAIYVSPVAYSIEIEVDCAIKVVQRPEPLKYGVCLNYLIDSDSYDETRKQKIRESLKALKVKAIRWNEGEIGDKMIWAVPPFNTPNAHATHLRTPGTAQYTWRADDDGKIPNAMQLDEAIEIARDLDLELFIIVGIDAIWVEDPSVRALDTAGKSDDLGTVHKRMGDFKWAIEGQSARETIVAGTEGLAQYLAKQAADIEVFVEIGNENYLGDANWKPECYAEIVNLLSKKIKDSNSRLRVGAQLAHQHPWTSVSEDGRGWNEVLRETLEVDRLDHFVAHQYGYKDTLNLDSATAFLDSLPEEDRRRIDINVTETGCWVLPQSKGRWLPNDLHGSLYQFNWLAFMQLNGKGKVRTPLFWTTRWLNALKVGAYEKSRNALNLDGEPTPTGQVIGIWNEFVHDSLVKTTLSGAPEGMHSYASQSLSKPDLLTLWLVNNHEEERTVFLSLKNYSGSKISAIWRYTGNGPNDKHPILGQANNPPILKKTDPPSLECAIKPYSITILNFSGNDLDPKNLAL